MQFYHKEYSGESNTSSEQTKESLPGKDQNITNPIPNFDAFVSYSDFTGKTYAETIKKGLGRYRITTFVAHEEQPRYTREFRKIVDKVISNCRNFVLLINTDTLERLEVIREVKTAYPNGKTQIPNLVIFRERNVERDSQDFLNEKGIDISLDNQHDFSDNGELATKVISLYKAGEFTRTHPELIPQATQKVSEDKTSVEPAQIAGQSQRNEGARTEQNINEDKGRIKEFKEKLTRYNLWKFFEIKGLLYKTPNDPRRKIQFMHVVLHCYKPDSLRGTSTEHLKLMHMVQEINKLDDLLNQITGGERITIDGISGSSELMKNKISEGSYYINHPQTELFGIHNASIGLLKPGNDSSELFNNDRTMLRELKNNYDTLPDVVASVLDLQFWDGSYSPFITVFAPIPLEIIDLKLTDTAIKATLTSSPPVDLNGLELKLQSKNSSGRQISERQIITGFRRTNDTELVLESDLTGINMEKFRVLKLFYYDNLIQEKAYGRKRIIATWYPMN